MKIAQYETCLSDYQWKTLEVLNARLHRMLRAFGGRKKHPSAVIIDSQTVRSDCHGGAVGYELTPIN